MKKLLNLGLCAFFAAAGLSAFAAELPQATSVNPANSPGVVLDGGYTSYSYPWMVLTWEGKELSFKEGAAKTVTITSTAPDTNKSGQVPIAFGPGSSASASGASGTYLVVNISKDDSNTLYTKGYSYSFTLPAGTVVDSEGNENPDQVFTYTYATGLTALSNSNNSQCINPQASYISSISGVSPYYSASELTNVTITYPGDYSLEATDTPGLQITAKGVKNTEAQVCEYDIADGKINLNLSSLAPDTYTLTVPAGLVKATNGSTLYTNPASSTVVFIIVGELGELTDEPSYYAGYMSTPLATFVTTFPTSILVSFEGQPIEINSESTENAIITYGDDSINLTPDIATQTGGVYTLKLTPASIPATLGQYTINIPAGFVKSGEFTNQALTKTFNYVQSLSTYTVEPAAGTMNISSFKEITIEYPGARKIEVVGEVNGTITLNPNSSDDDDDDFGGVGGLAEGDQENNPNKIEVVLGENMNITNGKIVVTLPENLSTGTLTLNFPANYFLVDGQTVNPTINLVYTLWDNMDSAIVLEGLQGAYSSPDVKFLLTWDYQTIEKTDDFSLVLQRQGANIEYPADAVTLISIEDPEGNTPEQPNALSIDFSEFFSNYDGGIPANGLTYLSLKLAEGSVMNSDEKINPAQDLSSNFSIYNPVQGDFSWQETETPGVYSFVWGETVDITSVGYTAASYYIILTAKDGTEYQIPYKASNSFTPGSWTYITTSKIYQVNLSNIPDGDYTVTIPNGLVKIRYTDSSTYFTNSTYTFDLTLGNPVEVNIAFVGENLEEAAESYVDVIYNEGEYQTALNVSNSVYSFDLAADATITFTPNERYVVALSSTVTDTDVVSVTTDEDGVVTVALNYSAITQEMDITKIDLTATVSLIEPVSVTLSFIAAEGVEETNVYELVTSSVEAVANGELLDEFEVDSNLYTFSAYPEVDLSFVPVEGYVISGINSNVAAVSVEEGTDGEWTAVVGENVDGDVTLTITVSKIVQPVSVTLNFIAGEGVEETNVYELVTSSAEAVANGELLDEFEVDSNQYTFSAYPEVDLSFVPVEGYVISGITSNVAAVSIEEGTDGEWTAVVGENVEGDVTLTITVSEEETVSINRLVIDGIDGAIYTLQGVRIDHKALVPGIYIIDGKKTVIK